uniref:Uncharacterized protein n=1 Tax=Avena sativa TaxID=4498 RepID=A0ACD5WLN6_AVESA
MVKKLAMASLLFTADLDAASPPSMSCASSRTSTSWQWPSCAQARTMLFHRDDCKTRVITNPAYCNVVGDNSVEHSFHSATNSSTWSTATTPPVDEVDEAIIRGIRSSSRLFFESDATSSIVTKPNTTGIGSAEPAFGGATAMAIDSADPYGDFRRSMEEMVLSHGGGGGEDDWGWLEEMLGWYLRANGKKTHGLIVGAFVDLLIALTSGKHSNEC